MAKLLKDVVDAINNPLALKTVGTVNEKGIPNLVIVGTMSVLDEETIVLGDLKLEKTKNNLFNNGRVAMNVVGPDLSSYQIKGKFKGYEDTSPLACQFNDAIYDKIKLQCNGIVIIGVEEIYNASLKDAGKKIA